MYMMWKKIAIGLFAGMITGLFGSGGGMILVPAFTFFLHLGEKEARATSVFCILPMVCASSFFYIKSSYIDFGASVLCAVRRSYSEVSLVRSFCRSFRISIYRFFLFCF